MSRSVRVRSYRSIPFEGLGDRLPSRPASYMQRVYAKRPRKGPHACTRVSARKVNERKGMASEKRGSNTISDRSLPQQLATDDPGVLF